MSKVSLRKDAVLRVTSAEQKMIRALRLSGGTDALLSELTCVLSVYGREDLPTLVSVRGSLDLTMSIEDLIDSGSLSEEVIGVLKDNLTKGRNIAIIGGRSSGKSTVLGALEMSHKSSYGDSDISVLESVMNSNQEVIAVNLEGLMAKDLCFLIHSPNCRTIYITGVKSIDDLVAISCLSSTGKQVVFDMCTPSGVSLQEYLDSLGFAEDYRRRVSMVLESLDLLEVKCELGSDGVRSVSLSSS